MSEQISIERATLEQRRDELLAQYNSVSATYNVVSSDLADAQAGLRALTTLVENLSAEVLELQGSRQAIAGRYEEVKLILGES